MYWQLKHWFGSQLSISKKYKGQAFLLAFVFNKTRQVSKT